MTAGFFPLPCIPTENSEVIARDVLESTCLPDLEVHEIIPKKTSGKGAKCLWEAVYCMQGGGTIPIHSVRDILDRIRRRDPPFCTNRMQGYVRNGDFVAVFVLWQCKECKCSFFDDALPRNHTTRGVRIVVSDWGPCDISLSQFGLNGYHVSLFDVPKDMLTKVNPFPFMMVVGTNLEWLLVHKLPFTELACVATMIESTVVAFCGSNTEYLEAELRTFINHIGHNENPPFLHIVYCIDDSTVEDLDMEVEDNPHVLLFPSLKEVLMSSSNLPINRLMEMFQESDICSKESAPKLPESPPENN